MYCKVGVLLHFRMTDGTVIIVNHRWLYKFPYPNVYTAGMATQSM